MRSINKVILIGNLTRDPELKTTPGGQNIVTFGLATNPEWVTKDGRKNTMTEFHDLVAWANLADICHRYLKKGKLVYIEGYLKTRNWDLPDGTKKFRTEIVVQDMIMLDKKSAEEITDYIPEEFPENHESSNTVAESAPVKTERPAKEPREHAHKPRAPREKTTTEENKSDPVNIDTDLGL